ncbi:membrane protein [Clostridioides difficile]|nr:membrane protein [Clostridioides difficile]
MKKSSIFSIIFPTIIMVLIFLTFATDIFNIPDIQSKGIFVIGLVLIFPISFFIQGIVCALNKISWILSLIVSLSTYIVLMYIFLNDSAYIYVLLYAAFYMIGHITAKLYYKIKTFKS